MPEAVALNAVGTPAHVYLAGAERTDRSALSWLRT